jgi:hypothetical protein
MAAIVQSKLFSLREEFFGGGVGFFFCHFL